MLPSYRWYDEVPTQPTPRTVSPSRWFRRSCARWRSAVRERSGFRSRQARFRSVLVTPSAPSGRVFDELHADTRLPWSGMARRWGAAGCCYFVSGVSSARCSGCRRRYSSRAPSWMNTEPARRVSFIEPSRSRARSVLWAAATVISFVRSVIVATSFLVWFWAVKLGQLAPQGALPPYPITGGLSGREAWRLAPGLAGLPAGLYVLDERAIDRVRAQVAVQRSVDAPEARQPGLSSPLDGCGELLLAVADLPEILVLVRGQEAVRNPPAVVDSDEVTDPRRRELLDHHGTVGRIKRVDQAGCDHSAQLALVYRACRSRLELLDPEQLAFGIPHGLTGQALELLDAKEHAPRADGDVIVEFDPTLRPLSGVPTDLLAVPRVVEGDTALGRREGSAGVKVGLEREPPCGQRIEERLRADLSLLAAAQARPALALGVDSLGVKSPRRFPAPSILLRLLGQVLGDHIERAAVEITHPRRLGELDKRLAVLLVPVREEVTTPLLVQSPQPSGEVHLELRIRVPRKRFQIVQAEESGKNLGLR